MIKGVTSNMMYNQSLDNWMFYFTTISHQIILETLNIKLTLDK